MLAMLTTIALTCTFQSPDSPPPIHITFNDSTDIVNVTMAGQTYSENTLGGDDRHIIWWEVTSNKGNVRIIHKLNRFDGILTIINKPDPDGKILHANCKRASRKF